MFHCDNCGGKFTHQSWCPILAKMTAGDDGALYWEIQPGGKRPTKGYPDDAGYDLYVRSPTEQLGGPQDYADIEPGEFRDIDCGVKVQLPSGWWGRLTGRSSTLRKYGLLVAEGVIDNGYRGLLYAGVRNLSDRKVRLYHGDRIAQLIPTRQFDGPVAVRDALDPHPRGEAGFGSTGS